MAALPVRLAGDPLRRQGPPRGPGPAPVPLPAYRLEPQQSALRSAAAVFEQVNLTARSLLHFADAGAHVPLVGLAGIGAGEVDAEQRLPDQGAEDRVALPLREEVARIDDHPRRRDRRVPPQFRLGKTLASMAVRNGDAAVVAAIGCLRPAVVL